MPRAHRTHAPGCVFHITARTQGRVAHFKGSVCDRIVDYIMEAGVTSSATILAFAVMPNHLHIVARQGVQPLGWMLQRVLQRTALLVRRTFGWDGHVFGRRYWSGVCDHPSYFRQIIIYTHLNPFYAGLCRDPADYPWTSHREYANFPAHSGGSVCAAQGLAGFAAAPLHETNPRASYVRFIRYWMTRPRLPLGARYLFTEEEIATAPCAPIGDQLWASEYGDAVASIPGSSSATGDVSDRALVILRRLAPDITLPQIRAAGRVKAIGPVRRQLIAGLLTSGCRNGPIARCLNVSHSHVSAVAAEVRAAALSAHLRLQDRKNGRS